MASNKMFTYITQGSKLTDALKTAYANSLIFLGDKQQIYVPALNTYVGIDKADYDNAYSYLSTAYTYTLDKFAEVENAITHNVPSVVAETSSTSNYVIDETTGNSTYTFTNGVATKQYMVFTNGNGTDVSYVTGSDTLEIGANTTAYVSPELYEANKAKYDALTFKGTYVVVDDTKTVEFIDTAVKAGITYSQAYTNKAANAAVSRVYSELLGSEYIPVSFDNLDSIPSGTEVYVKLLPSKIEEGTTAYYTYASSYVKVTGTTDTAIADELDKVTVNRAKYIGSNVGEATTWELSEETPTELTLPALTTDKYQKDNGELVFYYKNTYATKSSVNLADGIDTIKEIAHILDVITDGAADDSIALTYNIAENARQIASINNTIASLQGGANVVNSITFETATPSNYISITGDQTSGTINVTSSLTTLSTSNIKESDETVPSTNKLTYINGTGLVTESVLGSYVSSTYNLVVDSISAAETRSQSYTYAAIASELDKIDYNSTTNLTTVTADDVNENTPGKYIKVVKQSNGVVSALYESFAAQDRNYVNGTNDETKDYATLTVEGDVFTLSTYVSNVADATENGTLADAYSAKTYTMTYVSECLTWVKLD